MIIGVSGLARTGKDTVSDFIVKKHSAVKVAFADPLKRILMEVYDFSHEQLWGGDKDLPDERYPRLHTLDGGGVCMCCLKKNDGSLGKIDDCYLTPRYALQQLGTEWGRQCYDNTWVDYGMRQAKLILADVAAGAEEASVRYTPQFGLEELDDSCPEELPPAPETVAFCDVRFKNEMAGIKAGGGKVIRVTRPGYEKPAFDHPSETEQMTVPDSEFDYVIGNSGDLAFLGMNVDRMMDVFHGKIRPYDPEQADIPPFMRK
jgi:hypothetical protein